MDAGPRIEALEVSAHRIPTDAPEADGTFAWDSTTIVIVRARGGGRCGLGWTYSHRSAADLIRDALTPLVVGGAAMAVPAAAVAMRRAVRNLGFPGLCATAIAAVDTALWDLKARLLDLPLAALLGQARDEVPVYGSGGFTSYSVERLQEQLSGWVGQGIGMVKMKIGTHPEADEERVARAREAIGPDAALFVDANGAYDRAQALAKAEAFARQDVVWFEEPVSSDDLAGLKYMRDRAPPGMDIAAGEYGYDLFTFRRLLDCVGVLQADATRCAGITGFLKVAALCETHNVPLSAHTAPALHLHPCCALPNLRHIEYFHDHVRIEDMLFDGVVKPRGGRLTPDMTRLGNGLELREQDAARFAV